MSKNYQGKEYAGVSAELVRELFEYVPDTGIFFYRKRVGPRCRDDGRAGFLNAGGYVCLSIKHRSMLAHRVAFLWMTGEWPKYDIDHINGVKTDNRWANLRDVTADFNAQNVRSARSSKRKSSLLGTTEQDGRWIAKIRSEGRNIHIGCFDTEAAAHAAYLERKASIHPGFVGMAAREALKRTA